MVNMAGIGGTFLPWLVTGSTLVLHHPFDQEIFLQQIATERATFTVAGPALLTKLLHEPGVLDATDISSLRIVGSGSSALPAEVVRGWEIERGVEVANLYGSNEGVGLVNGASSVPDPADRSTLFPRWGRPEVEWPGVRASQWGSSRLVDVETGEEITEPGRPGELRMKGPGVFAGYLASQHVADPFDEDGYCRSGDLFEIAGERNQYYRYVDRHKDIIIRGGFNISAAEVENLVLSHPDVAEAAAVGYPDPVLGERTCVFVVLKDPAGSLSLGELCDYLAAKSVASYKLPERLEIVPSMVRNPLGKVVKEELRKSLL
jgi:acyl-CoA synthetase (AMP-forming)/AMP-acid ligase II